MELSSTAKALKRARKAAGLTQTELAQKTGLGEKTIMNAEQGKPTSLYTLSALCEFYHCDLDYLTGRIEEKTHDLQFIRDQTGLSEEATRILQHWKQSGPKVDLLSEIISHPYFSGILDNVWKLRARRPELAEKFAELEGLPLDMMKTKDNPEGFIQIKGNKLDDRVALLWYISHRFEDVIEQTF